MPKKKTEKTGAKKAVRKPDRKKPVKKKAAKKPVKKVAKRTAMRKAAPKPMVKAPIPSAPPFEKKPPAPPAAAEQKVGMVVHYYTHLSVAVVKLEQGQVAVGDTIHIKGHTTDFKQTVESMEIEHQQIPRATAGQEFGLKVVDHTREQDEVYKVIG